MTNGNSSFVTNSAGLRLWTERFGDPADPAVLLIMGTSAQGIGWPDELVEVLVSGGRQVIRFDHRDTGQSDGVDFAAAPYTIGDMARDALSVLDGHQVTAAHIAGASLGGAIGQLLAVHYPGRVRTLTAVMTSPMGYAAGRQMTAERQVPLSRVTAPTLVIHGTSDPLLPPANGQALAALIPGARFQPVTGMGHGFFSPGLPGQVARLVLDQTTRR